MIVLLVKPGEYAQEIDIDHSLSSMQEIVGGTIEGYYPFTDPIALVCNDEGKIDGLPLNRAILSEDTGEIIEIIAGSFFVCGLGRGEFTDISPKLLEKYKAMFFTPHLFYRLYGNSIQFISTSPEKYQALMGSNKGETE